MTHTTVWAEKAQMTVWAGGLKGESYLANVASYVDTGLDGFKDGMIVVSTWFGTSDKTKVNVVGSKTDRRYRVGWRNAILVQMVE